MAGHTPDDPGAAEDDSPDVGTPRWVKVFGAVAVLLLLAFVVMHLAGGGFGHHMR